MSKIYQEKMVKEKVVAYYQCDNCKKSGNNYLSFSSHHEEWGNDSIESWMYWDVCSAVCFKQLVREQLDDNENNKATYEIYGMDYNFALELVGY